MARIEDYGVRVYRNGIDLRSDRRVRVPSKVFGRIVDEAPPRGHPVRGEIKAFSRASKRRLAFVFANAGTTLRMIAPRDRNSHARDPEPTPALTSHSTASLAA